MADRLPSLHLLLEVVEAERDKQLSHFDAVDNKAGMVLAFSGLLITLTPDVAPAFGIFGVASAAASALASLTAFWPRHFPVLEPSSLRTYLRAEEGFTRLTLLDTLVEFVNEGSDLLEEKSRRLTWALDLLATAAATFAAGIVAHG